MVTGPAGHLLNVAVTAAITVTVVITATVAITVIIIMIIRGPIVIIIIIIISSTCGILQSVSCGSISPLLHFPAHNSKTQYKRCAKRFRFTLKRYSVNSF